MIFKNSIKIKILFLLIFAALLTLSACSPAGGDKSREDENIKLKTENSTWLSTINEAYKNENKQKAYLLNDIAVVENPDMRIQFNLKGKNVYDGSFLNALTGNSFLETLPAVFFTSGGKTYKAEKAEIKVPENGIYSSSAVFENVKFSASNENYVENAIKRYYFSEKDDIKPWRLIQKNVEVAYSDNSMKVSVTNTSNPYFGNGTLKIDLSENADADAIVLRMKGSGFGGIVINCTTESGGVKYNISESFAVNITNEYQDYVFKLPEKTFTGTLRVLNIGFQDASKDAFCEISKIEIGETSKNTAPLDGLLEYNIYSDRLYWAAEFDIDEAFEMENLYSEIKISEELVMATETKIGSMIYTETYEKLPFDELEYIVFHMKRNDIFALIPTYGENCESVSVLLEDGYYVVRQYIKKEMISLGTRHIDFGLSFYYKASNDMAGVQKQVKNERNTLTAESFALSSAKFIKYDKSRGFYLFETEGNELEFAIKNTNIEKLIYIKIAGSGIASALYDNRGNMLPIKISEYNLKIFPIQIAENDFIHFTLKSSGKEAAPRDFKQAYMDSLHRKINFLPVFTEYVSCGPVFSEIIESRISSDNKISVTNRILSLSRKDELKSVYSINFSVKENATLLNVTENFELLGFNIPNNFQNFAFTDVSGNLTIKDFALLRKDDSVFTLGSIHPSLSLYSAGQNGTTNFVVRKFEVSSEKKPFSSWLHIGYLPIEKGNSNSIFISLGGNLRDNDSLILQKGDNVKLEFLYENSNKSYNPDEILALQAVYGFDYAVTVKKGELKSVDIIPVVKTDKENKAEFAVRGGENTMPVKIEGFKSYIPPLIYVNGTLYDISEKYQVYVDNDGYYGFVFIVTANSSILVA